jgi:hypothetical protein
MEIDALYALAEREKYRAEIGSPEMAWKTLETELVTAIDDETKLTWEQYEDARLPLRAKGATLPIINAPKTQGARLADMAWLHTPRNRRPNTKRPVRKGRRYMATTPDHGTAPARRQIEANRREQLRKARRNRRNPHYTPYWKLRAQREEQTTWGEARGELIVLDGWGITEGLHYLSTKMCTDPECCPS